MNPVKTAITSVLMAGALLLWLAPPSPATLVVNVDLNDGGNVTYAGQGALVTTDAHVWNGFNVNGNAGNTITSSVLVASDGTTSSGVTLTMTGTFTTFNWGSINAAPYTNALLYDAVYDIGGTVTKSFSLNNLSPGALYNLYLYGAGSASGGPDGFVINNVTNFAVRGSTTLWTLGKDYVRFSNVAADGTGHINGLYAVPTGDAQRSIFSGLQFAEVPEPSTLLLIGAGAVLLWRRRQR